MRFSNVHVEAIGYEIAPFVASSDDIEAQLAPLYQKMHMRPGQLEAWTGIRERRFWERKPVLAEHAANAGADALQRAGVSPEQIGMLIFGGVGRDHLEPATSCEVAARLGLPGHTTILDISNACLGVLNGMLLVASAIELGQIEAGLVVSCETSRHIIEQTISELLQENDMERVRTGLATLTGGSGAVAVLLTRREISKTTHKLEGGALRNESQHHKLCMWTPAMNFGPHNPQRMYTDAVGVLKYGTALGVATYRDFLHELGWQESRPTKVICHQVGSAHQREILQALELSPEQDFTTYETLGNMGTVALPMTAGIAADTNFLQPGDRVGFLGIGSGLNCLMLGLTW